VGDHCGDDIYVRMEQRHDAADHVLREKYGIEKVAEPGLGPN
jgi:hypothetical protein